MLVFWDQKLIFLATPKTGSTAIEAALESRATLAVLRPPLLKHTPMRRVSRFIGPWMRTSSGHEFETVALMREPVSWLGSWYRYRQRDDLPDSRQSTQAMDFDAFARAYASNPKPGFADVGAQATFLAPEGKPRVDHIFAYEQMSDFLDFIEARLGCRPDLPRLNISPDADLDLSDRTRELLMRTMSADFALHAEITR